MCNFLMIYELKRQQMNKSDYSFYLNVTSYHCIKCDIVVSVHHLAPSI